MTPDQIWLYLLIVPPGAALIAAGLCWWATKRSAREFDRKYRKDR